MKGLCYFLLGLTTCAGWLWAGPVDLEAPSNSLGASDLYGNVRIWREIEDVDFGKGLALPLRLGFSSADQKSSSYIGKGWTVPVLESKAFLKREKMMQVILLCGKSLYLRRDTQDASKFQTLDKEWTGVMKDDEIIISRPDGWKLSYRQGKIRQMKTDTGRVLNWVYNGNIVSAIQEEGSAKPSPLQVMMSGGGKTPVGMVVNGKLHQFGLEKRPLVRTEDGRNMVAQLDPSLAAWIWPDEKKETFEFGVTSEILPTLKLTDRDGQVVDYIWEPSGHIRSAEGWNYQIGEVSDPLDVPRIARSNANNEQEFTETDLKTGITDRQTLEEGHRITQVFASPGPLYGKVRKVDEVDVNGEKHVVLRLSYDGNGRLFRTIDKSGIVVTRSFQKDGSVSQYTAISDDPVVQKNLEDQEKALIKSIESTDSPSDKDGKLQDLLLFYVSQKLDFKKPLSLVNLMSDPERIFNSKLMLIVGNPNLSESDKQEAIKNLNNEFPKKTEYLKELVAH